MPPTTTNLNSLALAAPITHRIETRQTANVDGDGPNPSVGPSQTQQLNNNAGGLHPGIIAVIAGVVGIIIFIIVGWCINMRKNKKLREKEKDMELQANGGSDNTPEEDLNKEFPWVEIKHTRWWHPLFGLRRCENCKGQLYKSKKAPTHVCPPPELRHDGAAFGVVLNQSQSQAPPPSRASAAPAHRGSTFMSRDPRAASVAVAPRLPPVNTGTRPRDSQWPLGSAVSVPSSSSSSRGTLAGPYMMTPVAANTRSPLAPPRSFVAAQTSVPRTPKSSRRQQESYLNVPPQQQRVLTKAQPVVARR